MSRISSWLILLHKGLRHSTIFGLFVLVGKSEKKTHSNWRSDKDNDILVPVWGLGYLEVPDYILPKLEILSQVPLLVKWLPWNLAKMRPKGSLLLAEKLDNMVKRTSMTYARFRGRASLHSQMHQQWHMLGHLMKDDLIVWHIPAQSQLDPFQLVMIQLNGWKYDTGLDIAPWLSFLLQIS